MLPNSACGETGFRASSAGSNARLMLAGLGVEMELRSQNPRCEKGEIRKGHPAGEEQGLRPQDTGEEEEKLSLHRLGKTEEKVPRQDGEEGLGWLA